MTEIVDKFFSILYRKSQFPVSVSLKYSLWELGRRTRDKGEGDNKKNKMRWYLLQPKNDSSHTWNFK